ncbi:hypothetical protein ACSCB1_00030 [Streptomyces europaeiscabiei]|uniref:hypothetical protein n=1 Tax=Streptomyces europaeiscabiei TaxID=146819 RepID=UPI00062852BD|nr:hypothetical protein [Streptomyces europaeiscabiei]
MSGATGPRHCCGGLKEALGAVTGEGGDGWQLVLVGGWLLARKRDAELAYLAQYEQHRPTVPFGGRRGYLGCRAGDWRVDRTNS